MRHKRDVTRSYVGDPDRSLARKGFGRRLAEERKRIGMTQEGLADLLGICRSAVGMIETGRAGMNCERIASLRPAGFDAHYLLLGKRERVYFAGIFNWDLFFDITERVMARCGRLNVHMPQKRMTAFVKHAYQQFIDRSVVDEDVLERLFDIAGLDQEIGPSPDEKQKTSC